MNTKKTRARAALDRIIECDKAERALLEKLLIERLYDRLPLGARKVRYATIHFGSRTVEFGLIGTDGRERREEELDFVPQLWHDIWFARSSDHDDHQTLLRFVDESPEIKKAKHPRKA